MTWQGSRPCWPWRATRAGYTAAKRSVAPDEGRVEAAEEPARKDKPAVKGWTKGKGWGWIWGKDDEVGSLNAMTPDTIKAALGAGQGGQGLRPGRHLRPRVVQVARPQPRRDHDLPRPRRRQAAGRLQGRRRSRSSTPTRSPGTAAPCSSTTTSATQIDGLGHITAGDDNHWYNGFKEADWGGNFGIRKCDATTIPPIITRGVLIDVAGFRKVDALPSQLPRSPPSDLQGALEKQKTKLQPGDTVLIRTGTLRYWGDNGGDHDKLGEHDSRRHRPRRRRSGSSSSRAPS